MVHTFQSLNSHYMGQPVLVSTASPCSGMLSMLSPCCQYM